MLSLRKFQLHYFNRLTPTKGINFIFPRDSETMAHSPLMGCVGLPGEQQADGKTQVPSLSSNEWRKFKFMVFWFFCLFVCFLVLYMNK